MGSVHIILGAWLVTGCVVGESGGDVLEQADVKTVGVDLHIDTTKRGYRIPDKFVGIAISSKYINGLSGDLRLFDPASNPHYQGLVNLLRESGVKHIRMVSGDGVQATNLPTSSENAKLFQFADDVGLSEHSVIYSLPLDDASVSPTSNAGQQEAAAVVASAQAVWSAHSTKIESLALGNETDCHWDGDTNISTAGSTPQERTNHYKNLWEMRYGAIQSGIPGTNRVPFSAPDACSAGGAFLLDVVGAEQSRISLASQHFYGGNTIDIPDWHSAAVFVLGDVVNDGGSAFRCTQHRCEGRTRPSHDHLAWDPAQPYLSDEQLAKGMLDENGHHEYQKRYNQDLAGSPQWPMVNGHKLDYRWTEANSYSEPDKAGDGRDPANQLFALSLWSLDFFHWWAAHGSTGVDPFTDITKYNSPIFQAPCTNTSTQTPCANAFAAKPYAYGMRAFAESSDGTTIDPSGITLSTPEKWLSVYAVIGNGHLYVTLINKSFRRVGAQDAHLKIHARDFQVAHVRKLVLASAPGESGNAIVRSATLGGKEITPNGWAGTWEPHAVNADGDVDITVNATTAVVLDMTN